MKKCFFTRIDIMDTIDISQNIQDFKQVFENESRIIFSAKFGDGKSYFLKKFMESYPKEANDYYFITLHPVNYVVEENRDVIEYIKRDILFQLIRIIVSMTLKRGMIRYSMRYATKSLC